MSDRSMPSMLPRPTSLPRAIACASIAAAIALSTGCAVRDSGPTSAATVAPGASDTLEIGARGEDPPLPPGWWRGPDGSLIIAHEPRTMSIPAEFQELHRRVPVTSFSLSNRGDILSFRVAGVQAMEPGIYEVTAVRLDRWGQIVQLTPRDPNAAADPCWIIVTVARSHTEYAGGGACDRADRRTAHQFELIEDDVRIWCACVAVDHPG